MCAATSLACCCTLTCVQNHREQSVLLKLKMRGVDRPSMAPRAVVAGQQCHAPLAPDPIPYVFSSNSQLDGPPGPALSCRSAPPCSKMAGSEGLLPLRGSPTSSESSSRRGSPVPARTHAALGLTPNSGLSVSAAFVAGVLVMACLGLATGTLQWSRGERQQWRRRRVEVARTAALVGHACVAALTPHVHTLLLRCSPSAALPHVGGDVGRRRGGSSPAAAPALAAAAV